MAQWNKIIVSGSDAVLKTATLSNGIAVGTQVISASQAGTQLTGSFTGSFKGDGSGLTGVSAAGTISSSTQIVWSQVNYNSGIVSSSGQVSYTGLSNIPAGIVSSSAQVAPLLPANTVSSSAQVTAFLPTGTVSSSTQINTGSFSGSFVGAFTGSILANNGVVSSSTQVQANLPAGTVSSSAQYAGWITASSQVQLSGITGTTFAASNFTFPQNLTVSGDLFVDGTTTTVNTNNLNVEDRFILVNSGSIPGGSAQGGIIAQDGANPSGSAIFYTTAGSINRWGLADNVPWNATTATQTAYVAAVVDLNVAAQSSSLSTYAKVGNIRVDTNGDIYIYS